MTTTAIGLFDGFSPRRSALSIRWWRRASGARNHDHRDREETPSAMSHSGCVGRARRVARRVGASRPR